LLYFINIGLLSILNFVKDKKIWLSIPMVLILTYLGGNPDPLTTVDYSAYESEYNNKYLGYVSRFEWLYQSCANLAVKYNLTYAQFRIILIAVTFLILFIAVRRLTSNDKFFWLMFALSPFFSETVQVRSFTMMALVLLSVSFLKNNNIKGYLISSLLIYLGTGFHTSGYIFFLILPVHFLFGKRWSIQNIKNSLWVSLVISFIVAILSSVSLLGGLTTLIKSISDNEEIVNNVTDLYFNGFSISSLFLILCFLSFCLVVIRVVQYSQIALDENMRVMFSYIFVSFVGMPLVMISSQYSRILREGIIGMLVVLSIIFIDKKIFKKYLVPVIVLHLIITYVFMGGYRLSAGFLNMMHYIGF